jgi:hypothetical protein
MPAPITNKPLTIAAGDFLSSFGYIGQGELLSISMPFAWTAAVLTFQGSYDGVTFQDIYNPDGTELTASAAASQQVMMNRPGLPPWIKIRSGTGAAPVIQSNIGAGATLMIVVRKLAIPSIR